MAPSSRDAAVPEVSAFALARALEEGMPVQVVDVRAPEQVAAGHIEALPPACFHARRGAHLLECASLAETGLALELPVVVVCGQGNSSAAVALHLGRLGVPARSLRGGMQAWMALLVPRRIAPPRTLDRVVQFDRPGKGALGYLLASEGEALVVDPPRDASAFLDAARDVGARVVGVVDTHVHADYISGAPLLSRTLGVPYHLHPADAADPFDGTPGRVPFHAIADGDTLAIGRCGIRVRHTPGHTEGSVSLCVDDDLALTGDFVMVGSVGRPDIAGRAVEWTDALWESVMAARREWPAGLLVLPAHYDAESERRPDRTVAAAFGDVLERNAALRLESRDAFRRWVGEHAASVPAAYRRIKAVNVGLLGVDEREAEELESGRNACALGGR